jgi:NitT/TauT family transport system substrate-binding protein
MELPGARPAGKKGGRVCLRKVTFAFARLVALFLVPTIASAEPVKLRFGWVSATADAPFLMFAKEGIAKHEGVSYTLEPIHFQGSPPMITALATNDVDLGGLGFSALPIAVLNAGLSDLRIIADQFQDGVPGNYSNEFLVLKDGPIKTIDDMKGKVAATNSAGSAIDMALRAMLRQHKLEDKRDYTMIEAAFPNLPSLLKEHKADLVASTRVFTADPATHDFARVLFTQRDALGRSEMAMLVARASFLEKNRAAIVDYLEDTLRLLRWYGDPAHRGDAVKAIAEFTKQPASAFSSWMFVPGQDFYHDPNGLPDLDALQANIAMQRDLGFIKNTLDVKPLTELGYVKEAARRIP